MKIYTLGTGHGDSTFCRFNSSTVYETQDGTLYLLDAGAPAEALMRRKGLRICNLKAVFLTHMHEDHAGGLSSVLKQVIKYPEDRSFSVEVYLPEERAIEPLKAWLKVMRVKVDEGEPVGYHGVTDGEIYSDENLTVTAVRTKHLSRMEDGEKIYCSFAYILDFKKENKRILHTGDLAADFSDFPEVTKELHFDMCLCEATHYHPDNAQEKLKQAKIDRLLFIHIGGRWHTRIGDGWQVIEGERELLECCRDLPYPVQIAHDGDEWRFW